MYGKKKIEIVLHDLLTSTKEITYRCKVWWSLFSGQLRSLKNAFCDPQSPTPIYLQESWYCSYCWSIFYFFILFIYFFQLRYDTESLKYTFNKLHSNLGPLGNIYTRDAISAANKWEMEAMKLKCVQERSIH